ncbi:MAG: alpha-galactosidase [Prevotella sp.]|nr:alpha-galactosidase [Prevotella sp.]
MNKKTVISMVVLTMMSVLPTWAWKGDIVVSTPKTSLVLHANEGGSLRFSYFGEKLTSNEISQLKGTSMDLNQAAYPAFGQHDMLDLPAIQVLHADGQWTLYPTVDDVTTQTEGNATVTTITMTDKQYPVTLKVFYKAYSTVDMIETWTEITHREKKAITLKRYDSGHLAIPQGNLYMIHMHGNWNSETYPTCEPINPGLKVIRNTDGVRNAHNDAPEMMLSLDGKPQENKGRVIGAALCWSGNYELRVNNSSDNRYAHFYAGIDPQTTEYILEPKEVFTTPKLAFTLSNEGMSGVSRNFHRWARYEGWLHQGDQTRKILLNSWEGVYFDINEEGMFQMMEDIKSMGGELFVMDDGWFGDKYQRNDDVTTLGDWMVDKKKLPNGVASLVRKAKSLGIEFGIWIEPESSNTKSEFFEKHPDWVLQEKNRDLKLGRGGTQMLLDLCNPKVQDFVFRVVDDLMTENPEIYYIKWDANCALQNFGSNYLPANKQSHLYIEYHRGLIKTLQRIRAKYPKLVIQCCSSGGGRVNYGLLPYFEEFWTSDNNDPYQRVFIQWGTSYFFPSNAMAQHIAHSPYWNTGRTTPIKYRTDVAMSGRLGMELQPRKMTDEEREQSRRAINDYKPLRELIQLGNLYRLISPYDNEGIASLMYTNDAKSKAVLFAYRVQYLYNMKTPRIHLAGLDATKNYRLRELNVKVGSEPSPLNNKVFSGKLLMEQGLYLPLLKDYNSCVFELTAE